MAAAFRRLMASLYERVLATVFSTSPRKLASWNCEPRDQQSQNSLSNLGQLPENLGQFANQIGFIQSIQLSCTCRIKVVFGCNFYLDGIYIVESVVGKYFTRRL